MVTSGTKEEGSTLILGLGNPFFRDDGIGVVAAREVKPLVGEGVVVEETAEHGMALLDYFIGYERAILLDAIQTGEVDPGTVMDLDPSSLGAVEAPSPHFSGLPEMMTVARELQLEFPGTFRILAVEAENLTEMVEELTPRVREALPEIVRRVLAILDEWRSEGGSPCTK